MYRTQTLRRLLLRLREQSGDAGTRNGLTEALALLDAPITESQVQALIQARTREALRRTCAGINARYGARGEEGQCP